MRDSLKFFCISIVLALISANVSAGVLGDHGGGGDGGGFYTSDGGGSGGGGGF